MTSLKKCHRSNEQISNIIKKILCVHYKHETDYSDKVHRKHVLIAFVGPCDVGVVFVFLLQQSCRDGMIGQAVTLKGKI